jgi:hypothetical protein
LNEDSTTHSLATNSSDQIKQTISPWHALVDLIIFISVMFLVRTMQIESIGFWGNTLLNSAATVGTATVLLYYRKQSWKDMGLTKPDKYLKMLGVVAITLAGTVVSIMFFEIFIRDLFTTTTETTSGSDTRFQEMAGNIPYFFSIIFYVWIESFLEELQDRGFSLNRFESVFSKISFSTVLAVLLQSAIFGFRHSYDLSPRSITTGIIGLVFGTIYVLTGRNLWPLIIAHIILNTMSMIERL